MRIALAFCGPLAMALVFPLAGQSPADTAAIEQAALDYLEGYYDGDAERMDRALHADFAKRSVMTNPQTGRSIIRPLTKSMMVEYTRGGGGRATPVDERNIGVSILDIYGSIATVKTEARDFIDYLHLANCDGEWKIMNVLWAPHVRDLPTSQSERSRYVGSYDLGQLQVRVYEEGDSLMAQVTGQPPVRLQYQGNHAFIAVTPGDNVRVTFEVDGNRATGFVLRQGGQTATATRVP